MPRIGQHISHKGFTLIEILVVCVIIALLSVGLIGPYNTYSNISRAKVSAERIKQVMEDARLRVIGGEYLPIYNTQAAIGIRIEKNRDYITVLRYPYTAFSSTSSTLPTNLTAIKEDTIRLEHKVQISHLSGDRTGALVIFQPPYATGSMYDPISHAHLDGHILSVTTGFGGASTGVLAKTISLEW